MADKARRYTDRQLAQMEKHITDIYAQATDEITAKWEKYMANAEKRVSGLQKEYDEAVKRGDKDEIEKAKARLDKAKYNETLANARYKEMVDQTTTQMSMANQMAVAYMNGQMPNIYVANYNQIGSDANAMGVSYTLLDEKTLSRAIKGEIPRKTINVPKDKRWNEKYINSQVTQGIIQGESMDKIAKRIFPEIMDKSDFSNLTEEEKNKLIQRNKNSSIRAARTMVTGVENLGRLDGMKQLEAEGIIQKKVWMATPDDRTRESHIDIDGEEQDLNEYFSNGCMFPGDGDGPHEEVWNCRCSMRTHIVGIRRKDGTIKQVDYGMQGSAHEDAIDEEKERRASSKTEKPKLEKTKTEKKFEKAKDKPEYLKRLEQSGIQYNEIKYHDKELTRDEIIRKLAGGDMTSGSCASLCFAYAGNVAGFDVEDFRGGMSTNFFCRDSNITKIMQENNPSFKVLMHTNDIKASNELMSQMLEGHEYILCTGRHAALVRKTESGYEYLEMQSRYENGWKPIEKKTLRERFGAKQRHSSYGVELKATTYMCDVDEFTDSAVFGETLGYINTATAEQKKGALGNIK